ncbi:MAG: DUF285 domain-containing protein [archaeon]|nr:DUF285 domain-containing protein [archaeon]
MQGYKIRQSLFFFIYASLLLCLIGQSSQQGCGSGYYEVDGVNGTECVECPDKCATCISEEWCDECKENFTMFNNTEISLCWDTSIDGNCLLWEIGEGANDTPYCKKCKADYVSRDGSICSPMTNQEKGFFQRIKIRTAGTSSTSRRLRTLSSSTCPLGYNKNYEGIDLNKTTVKVNGEEQYGDNLEQGAEDDSLITLEFKNNLPTLEGMFSGCDNIASVSFENVNTDKINSTKDMFANCTNLRSVNINGISTTQVTDMSGMFQNCQSLNSLDLKNFDVGKVETFERMFSNCNNLKSLDLSSFYPRKSANHENMFSGGSKGIQGLVLNSDCLPLVEDYSDSMSGVIYANEKQKKRYKTHFIVFLCLFILFFILCIVMVGLLCAK